MRRVIVLLALVAMAAPVAATGERAATAKSPSSVLAIQSSKRGDSLVRLDGTSLKPSSRSRTLGGWASRTGWSFSPDGRRLALGVDSAYGFRIYHTLSLKRIAEVQTWSKRVSFLAWLTPRRIIGYESAGFFAADPVSRKRLASPELTGSVQAVEQVGGLVVAVVAPPAEIGNARLAVIDAQARVRSVELEGIKAGARYEEPVRAELHVPGLVVDPAGRAFVVGGGDAPVAEVDLKTLAVTYHRSRESRSLLARLRNWLEPFAAAKGQVTGTFRRAVWLGDGRFAVWGYDSAPVGPDHVATSPAGLSVVDTRDWTRRMIDPDARGAVFAGNTLLTGSGGSGLTGYSASGDRLYRVLEGEKVAVVATYGSRAFVVASRSPVRIVDAPSGRILGTRSSVPRLLDASFRWSS